MADLTWPVALTKSIKQSTLERTYQPRTIRSSMDVGPDKVRARDDSGAKYYRGQYDLDADEVAILESFYLDDCLMDALEFDWEDPITLLSKTFRFMPDGFTFSHIAADRFLASLNLEEIDT